MKTERENLKEDQIRKLLRELPLEEPNRSFTDKVLARIELSSQRSTMEYTPVFSRYTWSLIALVSLFLLVGGIMAEEGGTFFSYALQPFKGIKNLNLADYLPEVTRTDILWYASLALILYFGLQVYLFSSNRVSKKFLTY